MNEYDAALPAGIVLSIRAVRQLSSITCGEPFGGRKVREINELERVVHTLHRRQFSRAAECNGRRDAGQDDKRESNSGDLECVRLSGYRWPCAVA